MTLTPEDFNKIVLKEEFNELRDDVTEIKGDVKKILTAVDGLAKNVSDMEHAFVSNMAAHDRFEQRIANIEQHLGLNPYSISFSDQK
jgi:uncharacterized protein YoxC